MAGKDLITRILIRAKDETAGVFGSLQKRIVAIGTLIAGYFTARTFGDAIESASDFEAAMSRVEAASGASAAELAQLRTAADEAGTTTKFTATEAAGALETLAKSGLSAGDAVKALPAVLQLAQAGGVELGQSAEFITKAVNGMGLSFDEAGRVADVLAAGANASNTSVEGLAQALSYAAPVANSLGLSLEETAAIVGKFADAGIDASRAGTALNSILSQFSDPASKFRKELGEAGITTNDFGKALHQLAAAGPAGQKAVLAVGQEAGPALRALLNQGIGALDELTAKLENAKGSAAATAATMTNNLQGAVTGLSSAWDALRRAVVDPLLEPIKDQVVALTDRLRGLVTSGVAGQVGEALRAGFETATKVLAGFLDKFDGDALVARLKRFAADAGDTLTSIGEKAKTAGDLASTAFGVMKAGVDTVLAALYKLAAVGASVWASILDGLAKINDGISKVSFGAVSARFAEAAREVRIAADGMRGVSVEFGKSAAQALAAAAEGAEIAARGWQALTGQVDAAADAMGKAAPAAAEVGQAATLTADQLDALGEGAEFVDGQVRKVTAAAREAAPAVKAMGDGADEARLKLEQAFKTLNVTSSATLADTAAKAKAAYETIKASGKASADDIRKAFEAYAEKAIEGNRGVVSESLKVEASLRGVTLEAGKAGGALIGALQPAADEARRLVREIDGVQQSINRVGLIKHRDRPDLADTAPAAGDVPFSAGNALGTRLGIANFMAQAGLDFDTAFQLSKQFTDQNGNVPYFNPPGVRSGETISMAALRVAAEVIEKQVAQRKREADGTAGRVFGRPGDPPGPAPGRSVTVNINVEGKGRFPVVVADERSAQTLMTALKRLEERS